jgi:glutamine---fructose-6-phosphate transaminase (isomerizing)
LTAVDAGPDRVERLQAEIEGSPDALAALLHDLKSARLLAVTRLTAPPPRRIRFVGMGSSRFAAELPARRLRSAGFDALAEVASTFDHTGMGDALVVGISKSGSTPEVVDAVGACVRAAAGGRAGGVLVLTNDEESALARTGAGRIALVAGDEASGIATRSYRHTAAILGWLVDHLIGREDDAIHPAVDASRELLDGRGGWLAAAADALDGAEPIHVVAGGDGAGTREQAALMCREVARIAALPMDAGDWLHVGLYTLWPGGRLVLLGGTPYDDAIARTVRDRGATLVVVGPGVAGADVPIPLPAAALADPTVRAIVEPLVMELIAAELWRRTSAATRTEDG